MTIPTQPTSDNDGNRDLDYSRPPFEMPLAEVIEWATRNGIPMGAVVDAMSGVRDLTADEQWNALRALGIPFNRRQQQSQLADVLDVVGITVSAPSGRVRRTGDWSTIGELVLSPTGMVEVVPRFDLKEWQDDRLIAVAAQIWLHGRNPLAGWLWMPERGGWLVRVQVRVAGGGGR
ncbi:hypothetical protein [Nocardia acidivorans]|uniref:hypothetical protein n=1 Tax=Nocardia acidivorans TaxID=404580 RepID=UPI00083088D3|nr:hypothetical protein [Nocardia acidivorans]